MEMTGVWAGTHGKENQDRIGLNYRGKTDLSLHGGQADFEVPASAAILTSTGAFTNSDVRASATLPESIVFGAEQWVSEDLALLYEGQWTRWSRFGELRIRYDNPVQPDSVTEENWSNVWRHSIGARYVLNERWNFKLGFAYDESPIGSDDFRTPRIPDADRYWIATGIGYEINDALSLNVNYAHIFVDDESTTTVGPSGDQLVGDWDSRIDIVSASIVWNLS